MVIINIVLMLLGLASFLSLLWWVYRGASAKRFEEAGRIPFDDEDASPPV